MKFTIDQVNAMDRLTFMNELGWIVEHSPWVMERVFNMCPFVHLDGLHDGLLKTIQGLAEEEQLKLLRSHPDLGSRLQMTDASVSEQRSAGLDSLTAAEYERLSELNRSYTTKFGFPFIMAVRGLSKEAIIESMQRRVHHPAQEELRTALAEIGKITRFRLEQRVTN